MAKSILADLRLFSSFLAYWVAWVVGAEHGWTSGCLRKGTLGHICKPAQLGGHHLRCGWELCNVPLNKTVGTVCGRTAIFLKQAKGPGDLPQSQKRLKHALKKKKTHSIGGRTERDHSLLFVRSIMHLPLKWKRTIHWQVNQDLSDLLRTRVWMNFHL